MRDPSYNDAFTLFCTTNDKRIWDLMFSRTMIYLRVTSDQSNFFLEP